MASVHSVPGDKFGKPVRPSRQGPGVDLIAPHLVVDVHPNQKGQVGNAHEQGEGPPRFAILGEQLERAK